MKRVLKYSAVTLVFATSILLLGAQWGPLDELNRIRIGFRIAPVPLNLHGKDAQLVGLGSYIVNAQGGCNDCHTNPPYAPGHDPFKGGDGKINAKHYLAGGAFFGPGPNGPIISANITPDKKGKPAGLTFNQFRRVLRTGDDPDKPGQKLLVMPWPVYGKMSDHDIEAIYEYLSAIPHAEPDKSATTTP